MNKNLSDSCKGFTLENNLKFKQNLQPINHSQLLSTDWLNKNEYKIC